MSSTPTANSSSVSASAISSEGDSTLWKDSEQFGSYVAQRISKIRNEFTRRRLENVIQAAIVAAEKDDLPKYQSSEM